MGYLKRISNYSKIITLSHLTYMMIMTNPVVICVEILRIASECSLEKEFT